MRLAVRQAATAGRPYSRSFAWVDHVHVEADVDAIDPLGRPGERLLHSAPHAVLINVAHREPMYAGERQVVALLQVDVAKPDDRGVLGIHNRDVAYHLGELP